MPKKARPARPKVIITRRLPAPVEARMSELFDTVLNSEDKPMDRADLAAAMADCDVLVPTVTDHLDADLINAAPERLQMIANFGNGVDHIDLAAARKKGIIVTNTPGVLTEDTADMAMALILTTPRRFIEGDHIAQSGEWTGWSPTFLLGRRITGKRLGIVGMGRIGQAIARRAHPFGLSIAYHNRHRLPAAAEEETGAQWVADLDELVAQSDIISLNCPLNAASRHLIDARRIALMKLTAFLINTARAEVCDEGALIEALEQGRIAGAGLDVYHDEPHIDPRLLALPNVVTLPHMGSATHEAREATGEKVIANIRTWVDGHRPRDQVLEGLI